MNVKTKYFIHFPDRPVALVFTENAVRNILAEYEVEKVVRVKLARDVSGVLRVVGRTELTFA